jgi:carboxylate-amine ligase
MPAALARAIDDAGAGPFAREMVQSQVEAVTPPCVDMDEARRALVSYRTSLNAIGAGRGFGIIAAGTHPKAIWSRQRPSDGPRYRAMKRELRMLCPRDLICGAHVHVAVPDPGRRVDLMTRATPFLPLLHALSTSSPFWQGRKTGLMGYRLAVDDELPRSGLPEIFSSTDDYERYVATMVASGAIKDASYLWWVIRPSAKFPTLELRIADSCTLVEDTIVVAALFRSLVRALDRNDALGADQTSVSRAIALENKWRAQRYGVGGELIDERLGRARPLRQALDELIELIGEDAEGLGCLDEVLSARAILKRGASADMQVSIFERARKCGANEREALNIVVDWLLAATAAKPATATRQAVTESAAASASRRAA